MQDQTPIDKIHQLFAQAETVEPLAAAPDDRGDDQGDGRPEDWTPGAEWAPDAGECPGGPGDGDDLPPAPDPDAPECIAAEFPLSDFGNAQRLLQYFGRDMLFVPRLGWFRWQGKVWEADEDEIKVRLDAQKIAARILAEVEYLALAPWQVEALQLMRDTAEQLRDLEKLTDRTAADATRLRELRRIADTGAGVKAYLDKKKAAHRSHSKNAGNSSRITSMLQEARALSAVAVGALNTDKLALCCENGVIQFHQVEDPHAAAWGEPELKWRASLVPHAREQLISKMAAAPYDPAATCPNWLRFLETVQPDADMRAFLQRWFGYSLTGDTSEQKLVFLFGGGRNGKSTAVDTIARIMAAYGTTIPIETLTGPEQRKGSDATPDLVRLPGARFVRASEPEQGQKMKEALIKALTGGEAIMIRRMMQEFVEITPEFKLTISGNHKPEIRGSDDGIWRRVLLVPFLVQIAKEDVDQGLPAKLWAERAGILAWMVRGTLDYLAGGLREPQAVLDATEEYRQDSDPLRTFLLEDCEITGSPEHFERARDLVDAFNASLLEKGEGVWGKRTVSNQLKARAGTIKGPSGAVFREFKRSDTGYLGVRIGQAALDRIAQFGDELRSGAARKG